MSEKVELLVSLLIPDTTAVTTFNTLKKMGYSSLVSLTRQDYYLFEVEGSVSSFTKKINKVDVLVNANKHKAVTKLINEPFRIENKDFSEVRVLVKAIENDAEGILSVLKDRLGFSEIKSMEKGTFWIFHFKDKLADAEKKARKAAEELLHNKHYQSYEVF